jgi:hypothetical protein
MGDDVPVNHKTLLVTDFVNLKIKLAQSFRDAHTDRVYVRMFIRLSARICMSICVCTVSKKRVVKWCNTLTLQVRTGIHNHIIWYAAIRSVIKRA